MCDGRDLAIYLDLGATPLANAYVEAHEGAERRYPLAVAYCSGCHHSQLTVVVPPEVMYETYLYVSSTPVTFHRHCEELVADVTGRLKDPEPRRLALDIASNDGCLLGYFEKAGFAVLGVDPARNLGAEANARGIETICAYWGRDAALCEAIVSHHGHATVVTATNVLAHVDDVHAFFAHVAHILARDGLFVVEVPYAGDLIDRCEFDTIYHEHLSYFLLAPMVRAAADHGLAVIDVAYRPIHGGTLRVVGSHRDGRYRVESRVADWIARERAAGFHSFERYRRFGEQVAHIQSGLLSLLSARKRAGERVCGYGASAKGNTLLNTSGVDRDLVAWIADDNPRKWNLVTPGSRIPIDSPERIAAERPDYLLLLAWNFADEIRQRTRAYAANGGRYITPIPGVSVVA
jgi:SAM-dependent methyltransferase